jgi:para-nitrobenzyl esterase
MDWQTNERGGVLMSPHAIDIPFALNTVGALEQPSQPDERARMADQMSEAWIAFGRSGNPQHGGIPAWPRYDLTTRPTMIFNLRSHVERDPDGDDIRELERDIDSYRVVAGGVARPA